ncbi:20084_t:CDS:2 [Cetraspora pellucida]|uniref:20084_t:CDS:1 n=1 Tax=Cetraspora pellucida TaxID=1433469 RepID=A0A9N9HQW7_9GLOM|nr:20084_t:CDS:2 [Cetraspora pellucida]
MSYTEDHNSYVESPIDLKPPPFPTNFTSTSSKCIDLSIAKKSLDVAKQGFQKLKLKDLSAKGLEVTKYGEDMLEEIQQLLSNGSRSKETNDQSSECEKDENKVNLKFQKFIEDSADFQNFTDCLWNIFLLLDNVGTLEARDAINKLKVAIKNWKSKQGGWNLIRSKTFSFVKFLSIPRRRFDNKFKINEDDLLDGEIVRGSKSHISQRIYQKYTKVAEKTVDKCDDALELKKEIKFMQELNSNLTPDNKLLIACGIANALNYCHERDILHGDIRTSNILLDEYLHPKLYNFQIPKESSTPTSAIPIDMLIWSSPERIRVMWAIEYQQLPFDALTSEEEIKQTILDENRPKLTSKDGIPAEYQDLIKKSWSQDPSSRQAMKLIFEHLNKLINSSGKDAYDDFDSTEHIDPSNYEILRRSYNRSSQYSVQYKNIEQGIEFHKNKKYKDAWEIFQSCYETKPEDPNSNFWIGFYYIKGFGKKDVKKGMEFLKKASDLRHPEAQYWYALTLLNGPVPFEGDRYMTAVKYLKNSAKQNNYLALEKWGQIVLKGQYYQKADPPIGRALIDKANKIKMENRKPTI